MYIYIYIYMYACMYVCTYARMYVCVYVVFYKILKGGKSLPENVTALSTKLGLSELNIFPPKLSACKAGVTFRIWASMLYHSSCVIN